MSSENQQLRTEDIPAVCGGHPVREAANRLPYARPQILAEDIRAVEDVLHTTFLTTGPAIDRMEAHLCEVTGARYAVAVSNGTAALHLAVMAAGLTEGDELITTPITFAASANCARYVGARPVFADIDPETWEIDPAEIERRITPRTRAVVPVDYTGQTPALEQIRELCDRHHLTMIEDAAHSLGTVYRGKKVGTWGDMTTFSFHAIKTVSGGEGGAVLTDDEKLYRKLRTLRTHGITRDPAELQYPSEGPWYYELQTLSMNYRLTDIQAALIDSQLNHLADFAARRQQIRERYDAAFAGIPQLILQQSLPETEAVRHLYVLRLNPDRLQIDRRQFFDALEAEGVGCNVNYIPVYRLPYYEKLGYERGLCPQAEALYASMLSIPFYSAMTDQDVDDVIRAVRRLCAYYQKA